MNASFEDGISQAKKALYAKIEERLVTRIEEIEGRVPSDEEVSQYGNRIIHPDGKTTFTWRGAQILEVVPPDWNGQALIWTVNG